MIIAMMSVFQHPQRQYLVPLEHDATEKQLLAAFASVGCLTCVVETEASETCDEGNLKGYSGQKMSSRTGQRSPAVLACQISAPLNVSDITSVLHCYT